MQTLRPQEHNNIKKKKEYEEKRSKLEQRIKKELKKKYPESW